MAGSARVTSLSPRIGIFEIGRSFSIGMKSSPHTAHKRIGIKVYEPTKVASPESTGGGGYTFEGQVQALFAVLMLCDGELAFAPGSKISKLQFQTRKNGYHVDDVRLELCDSNENSAQILIQAKRAIKFARSCTDFTDTVQAAWLDFRNTKLFNPVKDMIALVVGPLRDKDRGLFDWILAYAQTRTTEAFVAEMQMGAAISEDRRRIFRLVAEIVRVQDSEVTDAEVAAFLKCLRVFFPDTVYGEGLLASFATSLVNKHFAGVNANQIFSKVEEVVGRCNALGGELTKADLLNQLHLSDLRAVEAAEVLGRPLPKSALDSVVRALGTSGLRSDHLALISLVGAWNDSRKKDREIVCQCLGVTSTILETLIQALLQTEPPLVVAEAGIVRVRRRREIWQQTAAAISATELSRLAEIAIRQLSQEDNSLEVDPDERFAFCSDTGSYDASKVLREGLAHGMVLFAANAECCKQVPFDDRQSLPVQVVRKTLDGCDWKIWATLDDLLPYLAEVAPEEYLAQASRFIRRKKGGLLCLYGQERRGAFGRTYITGLVNSFSILAWFPEYLAESLRILGEMAKLDPTGQWHPRPIDVFQKALHPLAAHTWASVNRRVGIFTALIKRLDRRVAWEALSGLLPGGFFSYIKDGVGPLYRGQGRTTDVEELRKDGDERRQFEQYCCLAVAMSGKDPERLRMLENNALRCWEDKAFNKFVGHLRKIRDGLTGNVRYVVWRSIRRSLDYIRLEDENKEKVNWSHPRLKAYRSLENYYEPTDVRDRALQLFSWDDLHPCRKTTDAERADAVREIYRQYGIDAVFDLAKKSDRTGLVGDALGGIGSPEIDQMLLPGRLGTDVVTLLPFVAGYALKRFLVGGWTWVESALNQAWTQEQVGMLLSMLPFCRDTWNRVAVLLKGAEEHYWRRIRHPFVENEADLNMAVEGLLFSGCGYVALDLVGHHLLQGHRISSALSMKVLNALLSDDVIDSPTSMSYHSIGPMIKAIQADDTIAVSEKTNIEWRFIDTVDWFDDHGFRPKALEEELVSNPQFFCEALKIAYLPTKQARRIKAELKEHPHSESEERRISNVWKLLYHCKAVPGVATDGAFDGKKFKSWIRAVFALARKEDRLASAKNVIAQFLIYAPKDPNGFWMPCEVADLLEKRGNESMLVHYRIAIFNSRGVHFVDKTGREDRELAATYISMSEAAEGMGYFGLAREMRALANTILSDAARMREDDKERDAYFAAKREARGGE